MIMENYLLQYSFVSKSESAIPCMPRFLPTNYQNRSVIGTNLASAPISELLTTLDLEKRDKGLETLEKAKCTCSEPGLEFSRAGV